MKILITILLILLWTLLMTVWPEIVQGESETTKELSRYYSEDFVGPKANLKLTDPKDYLYYLDSQDYSLLKRIVDCESGWNPLAKNRSSTASGLFQFLAGTWSKWGEGNVFDPFANLRAGVKLFQAQGTSPWLSSKSCWS